MSMYRRTVLWSLVGNITDSIGSGAHFYFSAATNGALINSAANVPATAWFAVPCERASYMNIAFSCKVTGAPTGDRTVTTTILRAIAVGAPYRNVLETTRWSSPQVVKATVANADPRLENCALDIVPNDSSTGFLNGNHAMAQDVILNNSIFVGDASVIASGDACDWWFSVGKRSQNSRQASLSAAALLPIKEPTIYGLACVWVALKFIPTLAGGLADYTSIPVDAELAATVWS